MNFDRNVTLFYRRLLELDAGSNIGPILEELLQLLARITSATALYVELFDDHRKPVFARAFGLSEDQWPDVRQHALRRHTLTERRTGAGDTRASYREATPQEGPSLLAPIGDERSLGFVYLRRSASTGLFTTDDVDHARLFARRLVTAAGELMPPAKLQQQMFEFKRYLIRRELRRNDWNMTTTARSLGMGRAALYRALRQK